MTYRFVKYIPWEQVEDYERLGWTINAQALSGTSHGQYSVIGEFRTEHDEEPPIPNVSVL